MFLLLHMFKKGLSKNMVLKCEIPEKGYRKTCCETYIRELGEANRWYWALGVIHRS
jgi:hypothetical protein